MLDRKVTYYKPHGACWRLSNNYFDFDVGDNSGVMQGCRCPHCSPGNTRNLVKKLPA